MLLQYAQRQTQSDKHSKHENPYKTAIFPLPPYKSLKWKSLL